MHILYVAMPKNLRVEFFALFSQHLPIQKKNAIFCLDKRPSFLQTISLFQK